MRGRTLLAAIVALLSAPAHADTAPSCRYDVAIGELPMLRLGHGGCGDSCSCG